MTVLPPPLEAMGTIPAGLAYWAERTPDAPAISSISGRGLTHGELRGAVARALLNWRRAGDRAGGFTVEPTWVNGQLGALIRSAEGAVLSVWSIDVADGRIQAVRAVVNPDKLRHVAGAGDFGAWLRRGRD